MYYGCVQGYPSFLEIHSKVLHREGNGTPLQYSCLENPMDGRAWWAAVHGVETEQLHFHFLLSCIGEGNGNPLQCSCLENPRDAGALWAAIYGVAQSRTRLKRLSSSSPQSQPGTQTCPLMAQPSPPTLVVSLLICGILDDIFGGIGLPR